MKDLQNTIVLNLQFSFFSKLFLFFEVFYRFSFSFFRKNTPIFLKSTNMNDEKTSNSQKTHLLPYRSQL